MEHENFPLPSRGLHFYLTEKKQFLFREEISEGNWTAGLITNDFVVEHSKGSRQMQ